MKKEIKPTVLISRGFPNPPQNLRLNKGGFYRSGSGKASGDLQKRPLKNKAQVTTFPSPTENCIEGLSHCNKARKRNERFKEHRRRGKYTQVEWPPQN